MQKKKKKGLPSSGSRKKRANKVVLNDSEFLPSLQISRHRFWRYGMVLSFEKEDVVLAAGGVIQPPWLLRGPAMGGIE